MGENIKVNDIVKYQEEIYIVKEIENTILTIIGYSYRLIKHVKIEEVTIPSLEEIEQENKKNEKIRTELVDKASNRVIPSKVMFGRILHIDGDERYLESCKNLYKDLKIPATCIYINEKKTPEMIEEIITTISPDIIVITGHDTYNNEGISDINNYENTKYFIETIRKIRKHYSFFETVIIAGACASHFEALIGSGANFASSPKRINTHTYDPAITAIKIATTSCNKIVDFKQIIKYIENGRDALGGVETYGKMKLLL